MTTRKLTVMEMVSFSVASIILFMALLTFNVQAQELASTSDQTMMQSFAPKNNDAGGNAFSNNSTKTKAEILKERGVPGKGILKAPGLLKQFNPNSNAAEHAGKRGVTDNRTPPFSFNRTVPPPFSNNRTMPPPFSGNITKPKGEILQHRGVPGKGIELAPGLQKKFNPDENARKNFLFKWQHRFRTMMQNFSNGKKP
jgi:hypothetical protein